MSDLAQRICEAIKARRRLRLRYKDKTRVLEPYLLGEYADTRQLVLAWQIRCEEEPTKPPGWQHYLVAQIQALELLEEPFDGQRAGYNPVGDSRVQRVLCSLSALHPVSSQPA